MSRHLQLIGDTTPHMFRIVLPVANDERKG